MHCASQLLQTNGGNDVLPAVRCCFKFVGTQFSLLERLPVTQVAEVRVRIELVLELGSGGSYLTDARTLETLFQACSHPCLPNTQSLSRSSTAFRLASIECSETLSPCESRWKHGREVN